MVLQVEEHTAIPYGKLMLFEFEGGLPQEASRNIRKPRERKKGIDRPSRVESFGDFGWISTLRGLQSVRSLVIKRSDTRIP